MGSPFRLALRVAHLGITAVFIGLLGFGIGASVFREVGCGSRPPGPCEESPAGCAQQLRALRAELDRKLCEVQSGGGEKVSRVWDEWSVGWRRELTAVEGRCCLSKSTQPSEALRGLARAARELRELQGLYSTHVVQYGREIGAKAEAVDRELDPSR